MKQDINFPSAGLSLAGHLYTPRQTVQAARPAIVVGHPGTGVKEQAAGLYARMLAEAGYVTLAFDAAYQGESEGLPRGLEDPAQRVEDIKAAVSYLAGLESVDPTRIGVLGICASGGYAIAAAAGDLRINAVATVSAVDMGRQLRDGGDGKQDPTVVGALLQGAAAARTAEARGAAMGAFPVFPESAEQAQAAGRHVYEGWEYYCTSRAQHPRSTKALTWNSVDRIVTFDAFRFVGSLAPRPLLMLVGTDAVTAWMSTAAAEAAKGPAELRWVHGASHVDLYDKLEFVGPAVAEASGFFGRTLA